MEDFPSDKESSLWPQWYWVNCYKWNCFWVVLNKSDFTSINYINKLRVFVVNSKLVSHLWIRITRHNIILKLLSFWILIYLKSRFWLYKFGVKGRVVSERSMRWFISHIFQYVVIIFAVVFEYWYLRTLINLISSCFFKFIF